MAVAFGAFEAQSKPVNNKEEIAPPRPVRTWTTADVYLGAMARRRTARKSREPGPRTQPEAPRFLLSTLPFLALIAATIVLGAAIMIAAWPGQNPPRAQPRPEAPEAGTAAKGWFQEAQREFR